MQGCRPDATSGMPLHFRRARNPILLLRPYFKLRPSTLRKGAAMADEQNDSTTDISRRDFVTLSVTAAAGLAVGTSTSSEAAVAVVEENVTIKTADGTCDAAFIHPTTGAHPAVLIWPDAFGLRPVMREI